MLQLYRLTNTDIVELENESSELEYTINQLKEVLSDEKELLKVIILLIGEYFREGEEVWSDK